MLQLYCFIFTIVIYGVLLAIYFSMEANEDFFTEIVYDNFAYNIQFNLIENYKLISLICLKSATSFFIMTIIQLLLLILTMINKIMSYIPVIILIVGIIINFVIVLKI